MHWQLLILAAQEAYREDRELWTPLITPTTNASNSSPFSFTKQLKDTMGSATIAITSTTATAPTAPTAMTSGTGTGETGSGTAPGGGISNTDARDISDALDAALRQTGPGPPTGGGSGGPRGPGGGPGGPGGGAPAPIPIAHLVQIAANPDVCIMGSLPRVFNGDRQ